MRMASIVRKFPVDPTMISKIPIAIPSVRSGETSTGEEKTLVVRFKLVSAKLYIAVVSFIGNLLILYHIVLVI